MGHSYQVQVQASGNQSASLMTEKIIAVGDHLRDGNGMVNTGAVNVYEQSTVRAIPLTNDSAATFEIEGNYYVGNKLSIEEVNTDEDGEGSGYTHIWELRDGGSTNWVEVGRGTSFTLNNNLNFLSDVRVRTSYTDAQGFEEDVITDGKKVLVHQRPELVAAPETIEVYQDTQEGITGLEISDRDGDLDTVFLAVEHGKIEVDLDQDVEITRGSNESQSLTLKGDETAINKTLKSLSYSPDSNYAGSDSLEIVATDRNTNTADLHNTIDISIIDNKAPVITGSRTISAIDENVAAGTLIYKAEYKDASEITNLRIIMGNAEHDYLDMKNDDNSISVLFRESPNYELQSGFTFELRATDEHQNTSSDHFTFEINDIDDNPEIDFQGANQNQILTAEDEQLDLGFIEIEDEDNDVLDVSLHSMNGKLAFKSAVETSVVLVQGENSHHIHLNGKAEDITSALNGLFLQPNENYNGPANIIIEAFDDVNGKSVNDFLSIYVEPVQDQPYATETPLVQE